MKLISMTAFVLKKGEVLKYKNDIESVRNYANFLKQPLKLEMFVPCDEDGNAFNDFQLEILNSDDGVTELRKAYQQAKEKVLFENREEFRDWDYTDVENSKIEDLITDGFEYVLNENAIKQFNL
jgi:hypothetical protein